MRWLAEAFGRFCIQWPHAGGLWQYLYILYIYSIYMFVFFHSTQSFNSLVRPARRRVKSDTWFYLKMDDHIWSKGLYVFFEERLLINHLCRRCPRPNWFKVCGGGTRALGFCIVFFFAVFFSRKLFCMCFSFLLPPSKTLFSHICF